MLPAALRRPRWAALAAVLVVVGLLAWRFAPSTAAADTSVVARVKSGPFHVVVTTTGELRARKFVQIQGPPNAQQAEQYQMKISSLVPEGTLVKAGDVVAELDRSGIAAKAAEVSLALQKAEAQYTQAQLDSALTLSTAREDIKTLEFALEEKKLAKEQATYEAPTIQRQAGIDFEKAQRALAQAKSNYTTKTQQAIAKMAEVNTEVQRQRNRLGVVQTVMQSFSIRAPSSGMVIYIKEWNGRKKSVGSQVSPWDPTVATLPDLSEMESVTYVNEIDVRHIAVGQPVRIGLDADPNKKLTGKVVEVANVGEQRPNADAKVFEVHIVVQQTDTTLRPGMTTSNAVETAVVPNALFIPIEAMAVRDSVPFVYKQESGRVVRQEIETGLMSENEVVVARGLTKNDRVLLSPPPDADHLPLVRLPHPKGQPAPVPAGDTVRPAISGTH